MKIWTLGSLYAKYKTVLPAGIPYYNRRRAFWAREFHRERARLDMLDVEWVDDDAVGGGAMEWDIMQPVTSGALDPAHIPARLSLHEAFDDYASTLFDMSGHPAIEYSRGECDAVFEYEGVDRQALWTSCATMVTASAATGAPLPETLVVETATGVAILETVWLQVAVTQLLNPNFEAVMALPPQEAAGEEEMIVIDGEEEEVMNN